MGAYLGVGACPGHYSTTFVLINFSSTFMYFTSYQQRELSVAFPLFDVGRDKRVPRLHEGGEGARLVQQGRSRHSKILLQVSHTGKHKLWEFICMCRYECVCVSEHKWVVCRNA